MPKTPGREAIDAIGKWITAVATVAGLFWAVYNTIETRALEARKPFLDLQLKLYQDATESAATLATSTDPKILEENEAKFWRLYWGVLAMVENGGIDSASGGVEGAMVRFGRALQQNPRITKTLHDASLDLAHACRDSLAASWGVPDWSPPRYSTNPGAR